MAKTETRDSMNRAAPRAAIGSLRRSVSEGAGASVTVEAPARLHLGFVDLGGSLGRKFGSIGLAIDRPVTRLTVSEASEFGSSGPEAERALRAARRFGDAFAGGSAFHVDVEEAIPAHAGLGSGTQLALAVGAAILKLAGAAKGSSIATDQLEISARLGAMAERGARSSIGIASFTSGGFIVDAGKPLASHAGDEPPAVLMQIPFPEDWRAVLILDNRIEGVHGEAEIAAFARLPVFAPAKAAHIAHLVLMRLAPALHEHDIGAYGAALTEIQALVGGYFAEAQGGSAWSSPAVGALAGRLADAGAVGIGQSSWGPTGFVFVPDQSTAEALYHSFVGEAKALGLALEIVRGRNSGARIS